MVSLSKKHRKTLDKIFETPVRSDVNWSDIEKLLAALGAKTKEGRGSRIRFFLNGIPASFHRPHPQKETDKGALRSVQDFLIKAGIKNDEI